MSQTKRIDDIQISQDLEFQKKEWSVERTGWVIGLMIILAALAGLFGSGPLSSTSVEDGSLQVNYDRTARFQAPTKLQIEAGLEQVANDIFSVQIDRSYLENFQIDSISPQPDTTRLTPDWIIYEFQVGEPGQPLTVNFQMQPDKFGLIRGTAAGQDQEVRFSQFIYP